MEDNKCEIIKDLLPLYVDDLCSEESKKLIESHIESCESCKNILNAYKEKGIIGDNPDIEVNSSVEFKLMKNIKMRMLITEIFCLIIGFLMISIGFRFEVEYYFMYFLIYFLIGCVGYLGVKKVWVTPIVLLIMNLVLLSFYAGMMGNFILPGALYFSFFIFMGGIACYAIKKVFNSQCAGFKRIEYALVVFIILGSVITIDNYTNGNPISKSQSERSVTSYIEKYYPNKEYKISSVRHLSGTNKYEFGVEFQDKSSYLFFITCKDGDKIIADGCGYSNNTDFDLSDKIGEQITNEIKPLLGNQIPGFEGVVAHIRVPSGANNKNIDFTKDLQANLFVSMDLKGEKISKEDFVDRCIKTREILAQKGYKVRSCRVDYHLSLPNGSKGLGEEIYSLTIDNYLINAPKAEILNSDALVLNNVIKDSTKYSSFVFYVPLTILVLVGLSLGVVITKDEMKDFYS